MDRQIATQCRERGAAYAAQILNRIAESVDDVPVSLMLAYVWISWDGILADTNVSAQRRVSRIEADLVRSITRINPKDATEYVSALLRRCGHSVLD